MTWHVEWTPMPERRAGNVLPISQVMDLINHGLSGHVSVYQFSAEAAEAIKLSGKSQGFKYYQVSTDNLIMDCDIGEEGSKGIEEILSKLGLAYSKWASGGKGFHYYVPMKERLTGVHTPYSQKQWTIDNGLSSFIDLNIYRASSLIAAPGRIHAKTGVRKNLLKKVDGGKADIEYREQPVVIQTFDFDNEYDCLQMGMNGLWMLSDQPDIGMRHTHLWQVSRDLAKAGMPYQTCLDVMLFLNSTWADPKTPDDVVKAVSQGYMNYGPAEQEGQKQSNIGD